MEKKREFSRLVMPTFAVLLCLTLLSMYLMSNMYARYTTQSTGEDSARVAAYVFQLKDSSESTILNLDKIRKPGDSQEYTFTVTNKKESVISEVAQSYTIRLEVDGSMPVVCTITKQGDTENNTVYEVDYTTAVAGKVESNEIQLLPAEEYTQTYTMKAVWPDTYKNEKYASASGTSVVTLTVDAQQTK